MRRFVTFVLVAALFWAGLVSAAGGHPEVLMGDDTVVVACQGLDDDGNPFSHGADDHCCHSASHYSGIAAAPLPMTTPFLHGRILLLPDPGLTDLTYPPLPRPPRA